MTSKHASIITNIPLHRGELTRLNAGFAVYNFNAVVSVASGNEWRGKKGVIVTFRGGKGGGGLRRSRGSVIKTFHDTR